MITNPLRQKVQQTTPTIVGLEGSIVELYHFTSLFVVARENLLSQKLFERYGDLTAQCVFDHSYVGALRKLAPFVQAENNLNQNNLSVVDKGLAHIVYEFKKYDEHTLNSWRHHINGGLVREFQFKIKTVFAQEPNKYGLKTKTG